MASGNQICKPICADLPKTPQNNKKEITLITENSIPKNDNDLSITTGVNAKIIA
jgi:hypothetical protein|tara:strand:+ start:649 stop:810 length:162 start_codon:yes stop_codon:yes gene_type:complete